MPINDRGELLLDEFAKAAVGPRTKIVAVTHVSNALGTVNPLRKIIELAHAHDVPVLVDGAQAVPHMPVDVQALDCDFYAFSGHKVYGPTGIGVLYGKRALLEAMPPYQGGGDMIRSVTFEKTTYNDLPYKFEAGTPDIAGAIGLGAALEYITATRHGQHRRARARSAGLRHGSAVGAIPGVRLIGTAKRTRRRVSRLCIDGIHPHDHRHDSRPRRHRHPHRPSLRAAGHGALRHSGHGARLVRASTTRAKRSTRWSQGIQKAREVFA